MQGTISKSQFKPKALEYFRSVEKSGKELVITDHGRPVLRIVPWGKASMSELKNSRSMAAHSGEPAAAVASQAATPGQKVLGVRMPKPGNPRLGEIELPPPTPLSVDIVSLLLDDRGSGR